MEKLSDEQSARRAAIWNTRFIPEVAKAAMEQAEKRLADFLEIRKAGEAKVISLFGIYISVAMAVFSLAGVLAHRSATQVPTQSALPAIAYGWTLQLMFSAGLIFLLAALVLGYALRPTKGAYLGGTTDFWLGSAAHAPEAGEDKDVVIARHYALAALDFENRFDMQAADNKSRQQCLVGALWIGIFGATIFCLAFAKAVLSAW